MSSEPNDEYISIRYDEVPMYLRGSAFYKSLSAEGDHSVPIEIPCNRFKADDTVNDPDDLRLLLHTIIFWGLDVIPDSILDYCHDNFLDAWQAAIADLPDSGGMYNILTKYFAWTENILQAVDSGHPEIVQHWMKTHLPQDLTKPARPCWDAASIGNIQLLKLLREHDYPWNEESCAEAAAGGHLDCLMYLHEQGCPWNAYACSAAAANGRLDCLKYLHDRGCPWFVDEICSYAARAGHLPCLEFAHELGGILKEDVTRTLHIDCLRCALEHDCPLDNEYIHGERSFRSFPIEIVKLFTEHGVVWTEDDVQASLDCTLAHTRYLFQQGCQYKEDITNSTVWSELPDHLAYLIDEALLEMSPALYSLAVAWGCLDCVQVLVDRGCPCAFVWDKSLFYGDIRCSDPIVLPCIQYATERGWPCSEDLVDFVCSNELQLCWKYLSDEGIVDGMFTFESLAAYFQYLRKLRDQER